MRIPGKSALLERDPRRGEAESPTSAMTRGKHCSEEVLAQTQMLRFGSASITDPRPTDNMKPAPQLKPRGWACDDSVTRLP